MCSVYMYYINIVSISLTSQVITHVKRTCARLHIIQLPPDVASVCRSNTMATTINTHHDSGHDSSGLVGNGRSHVTHTDKGQGQGQDVTPGDRKDGYIALSTIPQNDP